MHFKEALCHVGGVGEHWGARYTHLKGGDDLPCGIGDSVFDVSDACLGVVVPEPHIVKGFDLGLDGQPATSEDGVVLCIGVERWIETDEIDASGREVSKDVEAVAVVEGVGCEADVHWVLANLARESDLQSNR